MQFAQFALHLKFQLIQSFLVKNVCSALRTHSVTQMHSNQLTFLFSSFGFAHRFGRIMRNIAAIGDVGRANNANHFERRPRQPNAQ